MSKYLKKQKAVVVFSGGQDSTTLLGWGKDTFSEVIALSFNYGQKHSIELEQAKLICKELDIEHHILDVSLLNQLAPNALTRVDIDVCHHSEVKEGNEPNTVVRGRNGLFGWLASIFASTNGIQNVVLGTCESDYSGYIDCRDSFIKSLQVAINMGIDENIRIHTPLMFLDKVETWELADKHNILDLVIEKSHTCYNGNRESIFGCKECPACKLRNDSLIEYTNRIGMNLKELYGEEL